MACALTVPRSPTAHTKTMNAVTAIFHERQSREIESWLAHTILLLTQSANEGDENALTELGP